MATQSESNEQENSAEQQHILSDSELKAVREAAVVAYQQEGQHFTVAEWNEEVKDRRRSHRRELYGELREKKEKEGREGPPDGACRTCA